MAKTPEQMVDAMIINLPEKTGKSLQAWHTLLGRQKLEKHGEMVRFLKSEHGVTHGFANLIVAKFREGSAGAGDLVSVQYSGAKAHLRPIYDAFIAAAKKLGKDVEVSPKKTYVSIRRNKQFALIQASTKTRVDIGLNLPDKAPTKRLEKSGSFNAMVSHRVRVADKSEIDAALIGWLKAAYKNA